MFFDCYPYTNFHNVNLDWVLQAVKAWGQTVEANDRAFRDLKEANEDFKRYVTNYLQDLDITDEINTKLDAMLASGVLTPYFAPYVKGYVDSWLASHVTPTSPALDSTLTLSGAAARADSTGHRLKDLAYIDALSTPEIIAALNRSQVLPGYRVQGIAYDYNGHYYVCGGSVDETGTGVIVKMTKPDFTDAEITEIPQLGHANDITYYDGYLYVCTVGGGNAPRWGIYKINVNDFTDKTLISNAPENTIGISYRQGDFWLLAPYRIYRTTDFTSYEVVVGNTNDLLTAYGIPTEGRISQTLFRAAGYLIGWVCSFVFEDRHYGALTFFNSAGEAVAFKMFPAYHTEIQGAVYADMSIYLLADGNMVNVFRMDPRHLSYVQLKAGDDLNSFTGRGTLYSTGSNVSSELVNSPSAGEGFTVQVERLGVYNTIQTARTNSGRELYRVKSFSAGTWGEWIEPAAEVAQIKEDLSEVEDFSVPIDSGVSVGTLTLGSYIIPRTGAQGALAYGCRSGYVDISLGISPTRVLPLMLVASFDRTVYKYTVYGYGSHSTSSATESFTDEKWTTEEKVLIKPSAGTLCVRFSAIRIDGQGSITAEQAADIASKVKFMRVTDATLTKDGIPADAYATGAAIAAMAQEIKALNLLPPKAAESTTSAGVTFVSDGAGNYTISGSQYEQSETAFYYLYHSETALLDGITPGVVFQLRVAIEVQVPIQIRFYNGTSWTLATETLSDAAFTAPLDAVGMSVRFIGRYGTKYTEDLAPSVCHPEIVRINSAGYFRAPECPPQMMLTIIDDDGHGAFYTDLLPVVRSKHVPITSAVICKRIDDSNNYMTWAQVQECYLAGADIVSHTFEHLTPERVIANNVTVEELTEDYARAYNDLSVHGIISPSLVFNNDSAKYGKQQQAARAVYDYAFSNQKTGTIADLINHRGTTAPYNILRYDITPTTGTTRTLAELEGMIDVLVANGEGWLIWMTHTSDGDWPGSSEATKLGNAIDYALANGVKVVSCMTGIKYVMI